jgi:hypothetical protein
MEFISYIASDDTIDNSNNFVYVIENNNEPLSDPFSNKINEIFGDIKNKMNTYILKCQESSTLHDIFKNEIIDKVSGIETDRSYYFNVKFYFGSNITECYNYTSSGGPYQYKISIANLLDPDSWLYCPCCTSVHHILKYNYYDFKFESDKNILNLKTSTKGDAIVKSDNDEEFYNIIKLLYYNCVKVKYFDDLKMIENE